MRAAVAALVTGLVTGPVTGPAGTGAGVVFTVQDPRIDENSGLVDLGSSSVVTNDSGDTGRVFVLDGRGRTVGVTTYAGGGGGAGSVADPVDVEALAPAGARSVWVGDIGDNRARRRDVVVHRVPVARGDRRVDAPAYRLIYPDGAHDAETLLRDPGTGRLYVVTKDLSGGVVYAAPQRLDPRTTNRLTRVADVAIYATDGSFLDVGRQVLIRSYGRASLYAFPSWRPLRSFALPAEPQGESLSVGPGDRIRIGSEGERQPVLSITLPGSPPSASASPTPPPSPAGSAAAGDRAVDGARHRDGGSRRTAVVAAGAAAGALLLGGLTLGGVALRRRRRRHREG